MYGPHSPSHQTLPLLMLTLTPIGHRIGLAKVYYAPMWVVGSMGAKYLRQGWDCFGVLSTIVVAKEEKNCTLIKVEVEVGVRWWEPIKLM